MSIHLQNCPECAYDAAQRAIHDGAYDLKYSRAIPPGSACEFEEKFGADIVKMATWAAQRAEEWVGHNDPQTCEEHSPKKEDPE